MKKHFLIWTFMLLQMKSMAQVDSLSPEILAQLKTEQTRMLDLFSQGDEAGFLAITDEDYLTINADGTYFDRIEMAPLLPNFKGSSYQVIEQTDRVYGNLVISTGRIKFYFDPLLVADVYFNQTWIYREGSWRYINWQGTITGVPKNYPVYLTLVGMVILLGIGWLIRRFRKKKAQAAL